jgi:hypothetical protein
VDNDQLDIIYYENRLIEITRQSKDRGEWLQRWVMCQKLGYISMYIYVCICV